MRVAAGARIDCAPMRIYVCWDTRTVHPLLGEHPCGIAYEAVREAGMGPGRRQGVRLGEAAAGS